MTSEGVAPAGPEPAADVASQLLAYMDMTSDLVGVVDDQSRLVYLNEAARKRLGIGDPAGLTTADLFPPSVFARYYDEIRPALVRTGSWSGELPVLTSEDEPVPMLVTIVGRTLAAGAITGLVLHGHELDREAPTATEPPFMHDELTLLPQRSLLDDRMRVALARAERDENLVAVVLIDVDSLKDVNDSYGHAAGDNLLRAVAQAIESRVRYSDTVARIGGDEFAVLLPGATPAHAARVAEKVTAAVAAVWPAGLVGGASVGVADVEPGDRSAEQVLAAADREMYAVKRSRRVRRAS